MTPSPCRRALAFAVALTFAVLMVGAPASSAEGAVFSGRVLHSDGVTPRAGVVVNLLDLQTREVFTSPPTDDTGGFKIDQAPAGSYRLLADSKDVAFLAPEPVTLAPGHNRPLALTLNAAEPNYQSPGGAPSVAGSGDLPKWAKWVIAGSIGVAALLLVDEASQDAEQPASAF